MTFEACFGTSLTGMVEIDLPVDFHAADNLHLKAFFEEALITALTKDKPLPTAHEAFRRIHNRGSARGRCGAASRPCTRSSARTRG